MITEDQLEQLCIALRVQKTGLITSGKTSGKTSGEILQLIQANPRVTIPELAAAIGVTERTIERNIRKLQQAEALKRIGPAKGGYWEVLDD